MCTDMFTRGAVTVLVMSYGNIENLSYKSRSAEVPREFALPCGETSPAPIGVGGSTAIPSHGCLGTCPCNAA